MQVLASTIRVSHTFEVVRQAKVADVFHLGDIDPIRRRRVNGSPNPKPWPYLHLWGGVWVVLLRLISLSFPAPWAFGCCLPPDVLLVSDGEALRVGVEGALAVLAPMGG